MYFTLGENRQGRVRVGTEHREGEQPRVYLLYTGTGSARLIETRVELVCDPEREGLTDGLFTVVARKDRGKLGIYNYAELHHKCCCPGSFCGDTGPVGADSEIMLVLVGTMLSLLLMVAIIGGLCYVKRTHLQIYSKLPGVNPGGGAIINNGVVWNVERGNAGLPGALMGAGEGGKSSNFRDYEPAAVASARRKMIPVLPDALIKSESVDMGQRLGGGVFADTHIARWNEMSVAVKRLTLSIHSNQLTSEAMELMKEEVWFLSRQRHKNIVCVLGLSLDGRLPFLLTEYIIGECLKDYLGVNGQHLTWPQRIRMCSQVADGMAFLHSTKPPIIHRDLRCGNLFLSDNDLVKVADFSLAKLLQPIRNQCEEDDCSCQRLKSGCPATIRWTAPELLAHPQAREGEGTVISTAIDVYSFAMIMWETVFYKDPFDEISTEEEVIEIVKNGGRPEVASTADMMPQFKDLMKVCWDQRPSVRPPFKQLAVNLKEMVGAARAHQKSQSNKQRQHKPQHGAEKV
ncbi:probable serine/threonine-protein kinase SIS8 [Aplysia californica]|uniref:Probable serine/threonine-protein kinase SIS8 n=1 Tax=Aplysia californica TaxID=6500 RepID=A0ABM1A3D0_APLCA|nr:probable serine/threonine-protein kinase SIS8 [Aplysia californica]